MIEFPKCIYRYPATSGQKLEIEGLAFDYSFVSDENAQIAALADGWALVPTIPVAELAADQVTRGELEVRAKAAGVKVKKHTTDRELALLVMDAEAA